MMYLPTPLFSILSFLPSVQSSIHPSIHLSFHMPVCPSIHPSPQVSTTSMKCPLEPWAYNSNEMDAVPVFVELTFFPTRSPCTSNLNKILSCKGGSEFGEMMTHWMVFQEHCSWLENGAVCRATSAGGTELLAWLRGWKQRRNLSKECQASKTY